MGPITGDHVLYHLFLLLKKLTDIPCQWGVEFTDEWRVVPAVFTVFVENEAARVQMRTHLGFPRPTDETDTTETHRYSKVLVVVIAER